MTTSPPDILKAQEGYPCTINPLDPLPLHMPGAIESRDLVRVLVFAAASRLAVHPAWAQRARAPSGPTVWGTLSSQCSDLDALAGHLNARLAQLSPQGLGPRGRRGAVDVVARPSHGTGAAAPHDEGCRSTAQSGTTPFGSLVFPGIHNSMIFRVNKEYPYKSSWTLWNKCVTCKIP
jgi:hypothetical protein